MSKERELTIKLLEAKIEKATGKKIVYENKKSISKERELTIKLLEAKIEKVTGKKVVYESKKPLNENLMQMAMDLFTDPTMVSIGGEMISKGNAALVFLGGGVGLPVAAAVATAAQNLLAKFGGNKEKALQAVKAAPAKSALDRDRDRMAVNKQKVAQKTQAAPAPAQPAATAPKV